MLAESAVPLQQGIPLLKRPWAIAVLAIVVAGLLASTTLRDGWTLSAPLVLVGLVLAFALGELVQLDLEFRRQTISASPTEVVIVFGLVEIGGPWTATAFLVGTVLAMRWQGYPAAKLVFNAALAVAEIAGAVAVLDLFRPLDVERPSSWLALIAAVFVVWLISVIGVGAAISLADGFPGWRFWLSALPNAAIGPLSVVVAVIALLLTRRTPWAWVLIVPLLLAIFVLFRQSFRVSRERRTVQRVYDFARRVELVSADEAGTREIVRAVRELLNADRVALWLPPYLDEGPQLVVDAADRDLAWYDGPGDPDDLVRARAVVPGADGPVFVSFGRADDAERAALLRRGAREVLGAPVTTAAGEPGYLEVCDRQGDIVSFADGDRSALESMLTHVNAAIRQQQLLSQIRHDGDHDRLTGLPNRQRLGGEIDALLLAEPATARAGLVLAALDGYTDVTDTLGHGASDELLLVTAGLLREHAPPQAVVARMEGGQFAVLLPGLSLAATERAARRLREAASTRARVAGLDLEVALTIGVAAAPVHGSESGTLIQRADVALLAAQGSGGVATYHPVLDQQSLRRLQLGAELETAIADGQISVVFQPIVDTRTADIVSVETLVRWAHPRYGDISPDDFISLAEQIGRIGLLTDHVLDKALDRCRRWLDQDIALSVAVNLSAHCLAEPDIVDRVRRALRRHGVPGELLTLELTEGSVVDDTVRNSTVLADLHALGLRLSMDDFGTGYSSLSQLRLLPIDELKIDKSFVLGMSTSSNESFIARSIVELAHNLGLRVVAEGVEDEMTRDLLTQMGCDKLQGFLVSRPLPEDRLEGWLLARTGVRAAAPGATHRRLFVRT
ncbi:MULTISPECIES: bifunctional diguanylate cyclase/phosphodiesterase [unclassified Modestobacter]|uniref:bifunctional diguanylate cyclase/phosphodiesterase n=1 Tax=unclassified Modestobacter TaxID=2643866 RepID=UPI0022AAB862|nr:MULTISPECIES: bifunctional diguanylate cyclase/phosphodiesterase [unclassified Modestobacter]MCZ2823597.1 bifunctional diguanylate cyclase/phosphodiesterase [Modestobacter sp. VKM Ac-2981]MCZ2851842.1 bifunctional diguanylate cyclase/phosphodiesterase [Modestobacter sp. VKM Ac-2982]